MNGARVASGLTRLPGGGAAISPPAVPRPKQGREAPTFRSPKPPGPQESKGFVAQGGDFVKNNGSGGECVFPGKKQGFKEGGREREGNLILNKAIWC